MVRFAADLGPLKDPPLEGVRPKKLETMPTTLFDADPGPVAGHEAEYIVTPSG